MTKAGDFSHRFPPYRIVDRFPWAHISQTGPRFNLVNNCLLESAIFHLHIHVHIFSLLFAMSLKYCGNCFGSRSHSLTSRLQNVDSPGGTHFVIHDPHLYDVWLSTAILCGGCTCNKLEVTVDKVFSHILFVLVNLGDECFRRYISPETKCVIFRKTMQ